MRKAVCTYLIGLFLTGCAGNSDTAVQGIPTSGNNFKALPAAQDTIAPPAKPDRSSAPMKSNVPPGKDEHLSRRMGGETEFLDIAGLDSTILLDIRYATDNNFTKTQIYDCPACLLRPEAAKALVRAHRRLQQKGLGLKMYDCYRPAPYQQRLWDKVPNPDYVAPPAKGSMHSRGAAVDLTIVDADGKELEMGTPYDFFGPEAHSDYRRLPARVLENRRLLRETLEAVGFEGIRTEWWHFSFRGKTWPLSDYLWKCD